MTAVQNRLRELLEKATPGKWQMVTTAHEPECGLQGGEIQMWSEIPDEEIPGECEVRSLITVNSVEELSAADVLLMCEMKNALPSLLSPERSEWQSMEGCQKLIEARLSEVDYDESDFDRGVHLGLSWALAVLYDPPTPAATPPLTPGERPDLEEENDLLRRGLDRLIARFDIALPTADDLLLWKESEAPVVVTWAGLHGRATGVEPIIATYLRDRSTPPTTVEPNEELVDNHYSSPTSSFDEDMKLIQPAAPTSKSAGDSEEGAS